MQRSRKRLVFALVAMGLTTVVSVLALVAVDIYLHGRFQKSAGYNVWGYRGPVVAKKRPGEYRAVMLGGSSAYGYGTTWDEAIPAVLEKRLAEAGGPRPIRVVNLGYNNEGVYSFRYTLADYLWLDYDLAMLYEGYNDMWGDPVGPNLQVFRHESPVFRLTGYLPIFPIVFREKAAAMLSGGDSGALYSDKKTVFRPGLATRGAAETLNAAAAVAQSLERQLERVTAEAPKEITDFASGGCEFPWQRYCRSMSIAVEYALSQGKQVLVVGQPHLEKDQLHQRHVAQQQALAEMLRRKFGSDARVQYVDLGDVVDMKDPSKTFDSMHLTAAGNVLAAAALVEPVREMAQRAEQRQGADVRMGRK